MSDVRWRQGLMASCYSTPTAGVLLGSGERAEGYVRRGIFYLEKNGCVPACVDVVQRWRP
eukprot:scaffold168299_cov33-Attheya_sp.AAC.1